MSSTNPNDLVDRLWSGDATLEDWTASVAGGSVKEIAGNAIVVSTGYLFGNVTAIRTASGLVMIDTGSSDTAHETIEAIRGWDDSPIHTVIYTHGHIDHSWGARLLDREADARGNPRPHIIAHRNVLQRFQRYDATRELNSLIMGRQFNKPDYVFPGEHRRPDQVYDDELTVSVGGVRLDLSHARGETDDATFVWLPEQKVLISGDFVIWVFPNAGNPRKVQRYAPDWAATLRRMQHLAPSVLVPGHGPVVSGAARVGEMLEAGATALEGLVRQTLALMNDGQSLNAILHQVRVPDELLARPYLRPRYDDPEFVVRNVWHLYAGWFDGSPAHLKPAPDHEFGQEIAALAGGTRALTERAEAALRSGRTRIAATLIEFAAAAAPTDPSMHRVRAAIFAACRDAETSLVGKAIMAAALRHSEAMLEP